MLKKTTLVSGVLLLSGLFNSASAQIELTECPYGYAETGLQWACAYLSVPEDHAKPDGKMIKIFVARATSRSSTPKPDAVLFAGTSLGGKTAGAVPFLLAYYPDFTKERDFIVYDHRGAGESVPALECPEIDEAAKADLGKNLSRAEYVAHETAAINACGARLKAEGHDLNMYNTKQTVLDMESVRAVLGYETINIFSYSYATGIALKYMEMFPQRVRSAILDSTVPVDISIYSNLMSTQEFSLNSILDDCKADKACNTAYPKVKNAYIELIKRLDASPITISISDPHCAQGATCPPVNIILNDNLFSGYFVNELFSPYPVPRLPKIIHEANQGDYTSLVAMINAQQEGGHITSSMGRYYSTVCHDNVFADSKSAIEKSLLMYSWLGVPYYQPIGIGGEIKTVCDAWVTQPAAQEDILPVSSDIPALILQGIYDPYSSPTWGRHVYSTLANGYLYVFPGLTHVPILGEPCAIGMAEQFIANPQQEPDSSCVATPETKAYADLNLDTGELHIPYVRVPSGPGKPPAIYDAYLMLQPGSFDFRLDRDRVKLR